MTPSLKEAIAYVMNKDGVMEADDYFQYDDSLKLVIAAAERCEQLHESPGIIFVDGSEHVRLIGRVEILKAKVDKLEAQRAELLEWAENWLETYKKMGGSGDQIGCFEQFIRKLNSQDKDD